MKKMRAIKAALSAITTEQERQIPEFYAVMFADYEGITPAGRAYQWDASGRPWRAALSPDGERIPCPHVGLLVPRKLWREMCAEVSTGKSGRDASDKDPCFRYNAEARRAGFVKRLINGGASVIWEGDVEALIETVNAELVKNGKNPIKDAGRAWEIALIGDFNSHHETPTDGILRIEWGNSFRTVRVQCKALATRWRVSAIPDKGHPGYYLKRGTAQSASTANKETWFTVTVE